VDGVVILSNALWKTGFGGDRQVIGRMVTVNGVIRQVVGVMPADFSFPSGNVQLWIPAKLDPSDMEDYWGKGVCAVRRQAPAWADSSASPERSSCDDRELALAVASDVRQFSLAGRNPDSISGAIYMPHSQSVQANHQIPAAMDLLVKTASAPARVAGEIRQMATHLNPNASVSDVAGLEEIVSSSTSDFQSTTWVFLSFAAAAIVLAAVGIYGLVCRIRSLKELTR
jgi:hypothetical protein